MKLSCIKKSCNSSGYLHHAFVFSFLEKWTESTNNLKSFSIKRRQWLSGFTWYYILSRFHLFGIKICFDFHETKLYQKIMQFFRLFASCICFFIFREMDRKYQQFKKFFYKKASVVVRVYMVLHFI
jgi:hypothetical protein